MKIRLVWEAYWAPGDMVSSGPRLFPRTMSESVALHVDAHGPFYYQGYEDTWVGLSHAAT